MFINIFIVYNKLRIITIVCLLFAKNNYSKSKGVIKMSNINNLVGERIRAIRNKQGLSQDKLAEKAGLHNTYIGQVERAEKNITIESLEKIVNALGITFEDLFKNMQVENKTNSISADCYEMILRFSDKEQKCIQEIIEKIKEFKRIE